MHKELAILVGCECRSGRGETLYILSLLSLLNFVNVSTIQTAFLKIKRNNKDGSDVLLFDTANFLP